MDIKSSLEQISSKPHNSETERDYRAVCSWYESQQLPSTQSRQDYNSFVNFYNKIASLYLIQTYENKPKLIIYDTENEIEWEKILDIPQSLDSDTCITQLSNGELFCYSNSSYSGISLIIDKNYYARALPSGEPCCYSTCIYLNKNIYCFGGITDYYDSLNLSRKFDLNQNRWINLIPMPWADYFCHSVIFNSNILISGYSNRNLLLFSADTISFSIIPHEFSENTKKILICAGRLYLIECGGYVYESEAENEYNWNCINYPMICSYPIPQVYCLYNKGVIYIAAGGEIEIYIYKFDLTQKNKYNWSKVDKLSAHMDSLYSLFNN